LTGWHKAAHIKHFSVLDSDPLMAMVPGAREEYQRFKHWTPTQI
jgi:hypothetical protein